MTHQPKPPFALSEGPRNARIALVGEALGETELRLSRPFVGTAGKELDRLLAEAGILRGDCFLTNTIAARPSPTSNNFDLLCAKRKDVGGKDYPLPALGQGKYLKPEYLGELTRLQAELRQVKPNVVVALGAKASWALCGNPAISSIRGTICESSLVPGQKVLPTFHPSYILRMWSDRPVLLADLLKAKRESASAAIERPARNVLCSPTLEELWRWVEETLAQKPWRLACDIETTRGQIEMIGFARSASDAIVVPFRVRQEHQWVNYWPTTYDEVQARKACQRLLESEIPKVGQNFLYDTQYLLAEGFRLRSISDDLMLAHHSLYPELKKGLGFLGSIYTQEAAWKLMRKRRNEEELKRDE